MVAKIEPASLAHRSPESAQPAARRVTLIDEPLVLSRIACVLVWGALVFFAVFNGVLLGVLAVVYSQNEQNGSLLWLFRIYFLYQDGNAFLMKNSKRLALGYGVLCACFGIVIARMLWMPVRKRKTKPRVQGLTAGSKHRGCNVVTTALHRTASYVLDVRHAVSVRGPHFDIRLLLEEIIEIGGQTASAYSASQSISNVPLNVTFAAVILLNGVSALFFRAVFKTDLIKQRAACLVSDLVLDFVWGSMLPIWMYLPVLEIYADRVNVTHYLLNFTNSTREIERVLVTSWKNYVLSVLPFCSSLTNLVELYDILRRMPHQASTPHKTQQKIKEAWVRKEHPVRNYQNCHHARLIRLAHLLLPLYGVGVLIVSMAANDVISVDSSRQSPVLCMHRVHPWFSTKEACLGRVINCTALGITGNKSELELALSQFEESTLSELHFFSCPGLEMPSVIHDFPRLTSLIIGDANLVRWGIEANLSGEFFSELRTVQLYGVELGDDPLGLIGTEPLAETLEWIHLDNVDGSRVLPFAGDNWRAVLTVVCVACGLTSLPDVLYRIPVLMTVSLFANNITSIPTNWLEDSPVHLQMLFLLANPLLTTLPDSLWRQAATCGVFHLAETNLSVVPDWVADIAGPDFMLTAYETPVCSGAVPLSPRVKSRLICDVPPGR